MRVGIRGQEVHLGLDYDAVLTKDTEMTDYGVLKSIKLYDEKGRYIVFNKQGSCIQQLVDYLFETYYHHHIYVMVPDLDIFFSYLYLDLIVPRNYTDLCEGNPRFSYASTPDGSWRYMYGAHIYYTIIKDKNTIIHFQSLEGKIKTNVQDPQMFLRRAEHLENDCGFKGLFYALNGSSSFESYAVKNFMRQGDKATEQKNVECWERTHPDFREKNPECYKVFVEEQADADYTLAYKPALKAMVGHYEAIKFDCNNMYPSILCTEFLPHGYPRYTEGDPEHDTFYRGIDNRTRFCHLYIQGGYRTCVEDLDQGAVPLELKVWMWSFEFREMLRVHPKMKWRLIESYDFSGYELDEARKEYLKSNYRKYKETGNKMYKKLNNVIYGKFSQRSIKDRKVPYINEHGILDYRKEPIEDYKPVSQYYPLGSAIVAWGRVWISRILHNINLRPSDILYVDTDSFALKKYPEVEEYINNAIKVGDLFGEWKKELDGEFDIYSLKSYYGEGIDKVVEANAGGGKRSEATFFDKETGESVTTVYQIQRTATGFVRVPVVKDTRTRGENLCILEKSLDN